MQIATPESILTNDQAARQLGLHPNTLSNLRRFGEGPDYFRLGKHTIGYRTEDVCLWGERRARR